MADTYTAKDYLTAADALSRSIERLMIQSDRFLDRATSELAAESSPEVTVTEFGDGSMQLGVGSVILAVISDDRARPAVAPYYDARGGNA